MASSSDATGDSQPPTTSEASRAADTPSQPEVPRRGSLLGIDYGTKRLGFAVCDPAQTLASPLESWSVGDRLQDERRLRKHVADYRIVGIVIGLPVHMSGDESGKSREARRFGGWASRITGLPIAYWDERYSSAIADERLRSQDVSAKGRQKRRDMLAAQVLLQRYLDAADRSLPPLDFSGDSGGPVR